jgi:hypothetical protein
VLGSKISLISAQTVAAIGAFLIVAYGWDAQGEYTLPAFLLLARFGISASFNICYLSNATLFPTLFSVTSVGICNAGARMTTIAAPMVAEIRGKTPIWIVLCLCLMTAFAACFLRRPSYL